MRRGAAACARAAATRARLERQPRPQFWLTRARPRPAAVQADASAPERSASASAPKAAAAAESGETDGLLVRKQAALEAALALSRKEVRPALGARRGAQAPPRPVSRWRSLAAAVAPQPGRAPHPTP
jgi:hypothetical protein